MYLDSAITGTNLEIYTRAHQLSITQPMSDFTKLIQDYKCILLLTFHVCSLCSAPSVTAAGGASMGSVISGYLFFGPSVAIKLPGM